MSLIVQKYGGTSVGSIEKIRGVAERVLESAREGHQMVIVLSAMAGQTDSLIGLAHEVTEMVGFVPDWTWEEDESQGDRNARQARK